MQVQNIRYVAFVSEASALNSDVYHKQRTIMEPDTGREAEDALSSLAFR